MGYGAYSHTAHVALTRRHATTSRAEVFRQRACHPQMDPHGVKHRECRDSEPHPNSVGIIMALDVSGSMGDIPARLATHTLPDFMQAMADAGGDRAPLQVGQFESTASTGTSPPPTCSKSCSAPTSPST